MVAFTKSLASLLLASVTSAKLAVYNTVKDVVTACPCAVFRYFPDYEEETLKNYPVVFLEGEIACSPTRDLVAGKIVVANFEVGAVVVHAIVDYYIRAYHSINGKENYGYLSKLFIL